MDIITKIWPQWETVELIGSGSFGKVYKARREELGNEYFSAIKVMRIPSDQSEVKDLQRSGMDAGSIRSYYEDMIRNLLNEIQIMESLKSANNIVGIEDHQVVKIEEGIGWEIYIRMELLVDLGSYLEQHTMSIDEIVQLGIDVCRALIACEKVNIIHRDIKIDNVFVNEFGSFKLGDFGISKQLEKTQSAVSQKGTNMYMAPEVFRGEHYDQTVDIYSLGIMMYRLANDGRFPFMPPVTQPLQFNDTQKALEKRLAGEPMPEPHNADAELSRIIRKACEYRPENRYQSAEELAKELQQYSYRKNTRPSGQPETQSEHVAESIQTVKTEDERTYAAFSTGVEKHSVQQGGNEKQSHSDAPEWSLSGNPTVAAALEVATGIDSSENEAVKQLDFANDSLVEAKRGQEEELEKTMAAIPEPIPSKPIKTESVKTEQPQPELKSEEKVKEKTKPKKSHKGIFIGIGAAVLVLGVLASLYFFVGNPFGAKEKAASEETRTTVERLGVSLQFPEGWEVKKDEDSAWAYKRDEAKTTITVYIRWTLNWAEDEVDQTGGMSQKLAEELVGRFLGVKESALYEINGRNYCFIRFEEEGGEQARFMTFEDGRMLSFDVYKTGTLAEEDIKTLQEVMKSVQLNFEGIDYSELRPADADEKPFVLATEQTTAQGIGISLKLPAVCKVSADEENRLVAEYSGSTYNDAYTLQIVKKDVSALGYIDNGVNDATAQKILETEESESGHAVEKYLYEDVGGRTYIYMRAKDSEKVYATMVTVVNGVQYSFRFDSEQYSYVDYSELKLFLRELTGSVVYS